MGQLKKMAIVTPGLLPVPAVNGGAVETLITYLIEGNEANPHYQFTVYTCADKKLDAIKYRHCEIVQIANKGYCRYFSIGMNLLEKYAHIGHGANPYHMHLGKEDWSRFDDILVENSMKTYEYLYGIKSCHGKLSYHMHNDVEDENGDKSPKRTRLIMDTCKHFLTVSEYIKRRVIDTCEVGGKICHKLSVLYNCVDVDLFKHDVCKEEELRYLHHLGSDNFVILYSGRIAEEKGVLELVRSMRVICAEHDNVKLLIVGCCWFPNVMESSYMDEIKKEVDKYGQNVVFTGFIPPEEIAVYYDLCDMVVVPTKCQEAFGISALEAMAAGKPVVVTKSGGMPEVVDGDCSFQIPIGMDMERHIEQAIYTIYKNPDIKKQMGEKGKMRAKAIRSFSKKYYYSEFLLNIGG